MYGSKFVTRIWNAGFYPCFNVNIRHQGSIYQGPFKRTMSSTPPPPRNVRRRSGCAPSYVRFQELKERLREPLQLGPEALALSFQNGRGALGLRPVSGFGFRSLGAERDSWVGRERRKEGNIALFWFRGGGGAESESGLGETLSGLGCEETDAEIGRPRSRNSVKKVLEEKQSLAEQGVEAVEMDGFKRVP